MKNPSLTLLGILIVVLIGWIAISLHEAKANGRYQIAEDNNTKIIDTRTGETFIVVRSDREKRFDLKTVTYSGTPE
jgi:hypothetical protein